MTECTKCKRCGMDVHMRGVKTYWGTECIAKHSVVSADGHLCYQCWCHFMESLNEAVRVAATQFCKDTEIALELRHPDVRAIQECAA